jgi:predicted permease
MGVMSALFGVIAPVMVVTLIGYVWGIRKYEFDHGLITRLVTAVGAPAMVFSTFTSITLPAEAMLRMSEAALACVCAFAVIGVSVLTVVRLPIRVYLPSLIFPNIGNMGLPVCLLAFGQSGFALAMIYFTLVTVLQFTAGPAIAAGQARWTAPLRVPFIYAVAAALVVSFAHLPIPPWIASTASLLGGMTIPLMLLSLGVALAQLRTANIGRAVAFSVLRLAMGAGVGWAVATAMDLSAAERGVVVIQSAMPVAIFNFLFARMYDNRPDEVAGMVLMSTVLSYASLPVMVALVM